VKSCKIATELRTPNTEGDISQKNSLENLCWASQFQCYLPGFRPNLTKPNQIVKKCVFFVWASTEWVQTFGDSTKTVKPNANFGDFDPKAIYEGFASESRSLDHFGHKAPQPTSRISSRVKFPTLSPYIYNK
jgi:hypothetical protein